MLKFGGYQNEQFNIVYPYLLPSSNIAHSLGQEPFTYYYNGLLDVLINDLLDTEHLHDNGLKTNLLGALSALTKIVTTEPKCDKEKVAQIFAIV
jgi:hypothetical protein